MYTKHFGLTEEPFSIAANPRFLYMSTGHREALAHLLYGIRSDSGFVLLTGEVGTGKTTVCRCLLEQLPENTEVAFILNPKVSAIELLSSICDELGILCQGHDHSVKTFVDAINRHLLAHHAEGRNTVVIIDEAQNLSADVLEQLRLLTNLETNERKLMRIILLGQPELEVMLARPELRQVEQRITARYHLQPLLRSEINAYVQHRLAVAGRQSPVFSKRVLAKLYSETGGIPRLINIICDRAMLGAYVKSRHKVDGSLLTRAAREVQGRSYQQRWLLRGSMVTFALLVAAAAAAALFYVNDKEITTVLSQPPLELQPRVAIDPPPVAEKPVALPLWPDEAVARDDALTAAYLAQFKQWDIPLPAGNADPCALAISRGLRCFSGVGNLGSLISNNRPVILTLVDKEGRQYHATLLALEGELATVVFAHGIEMVTVQDLEARWQGQYQMLWRASPNGYSIVKPGSRGSDVTWLTKNLLAAGIKSVQVHDVYDKDVVAAVQVFQRNHGLLADGITGRQTLIQLNSASDKSVPQLIKQRDG
jgi:general secretion pathway protein A